MAKEFEGVQPSVLTGIAQALTDIKNKAHAIESGVDSIAPLTTDATVKATLEEISIQSNNIGKWCGDIYRRIAKEALS